MARLSNYLRNQAGIQSGRGHAYPIKLTPAQFVELTGELGYEPTTFKTALGEHKIEKILCNTRATGDNVILAPREDLFSEVERESGIELVSLANEVTSVADNIACCEIVSVGELVTNVKVGDLAFIDFFDVKQGYVIENETLFISGSDAFKALFDVNAQVVLPMENYVVTKRVNKRFKVALTGTDRVEVLDSLLTDGIPGGKNSVGKTTAHILYEEVVSTGNITNRARPGCMTPAEKRLLDAAVAGQLTDDLILTVREEAKKGRKCDVSKGELVVFTKEISTPVRVRGEFQHIIHIDNVLSTIDDEAILDDGFKSGTAGQLVNTSSRLIV